MEIRDLQECMTRLMDQIATLPSQRAPHEGVVAGTLARHDAARAAASEIEDALADIRLNMAYLTFDLEATRRECEQLRHRLESRDHDLE